MKIDFRRVSAAWPVVTTLAAVVLLAGYLIGAPIYRRAVLRTDLERAVRMFEIGYVPHIALTDFTGFDWTEVHIFPPYSTIEQIEAGIGTSWSRFASDEIQTDDSITLLVFMDDGRLVRWVEIARSIADYTDVADGSPYSPETAVFIMPVEGEPGMVVLNTTEFP